MSHTFNCVIIKEEIEQPQSDTENIDNPNTAYGTDVLDSKVICNENEMKLEPYDEKEERDPLYEAQLMEVEITVVKAESDSSSSPPKKYPTPTVIGSSTSMLYFEANHDSKNIGMKLKPADEEMKEQDPLYTNSVVKVEVTVEPNIEPDPLRAQRHIDGKNSLQYDDEISWSNKQYYCKMCGQNCDSLSDLTIHMQIIHKESHTSSDTEKSLTSDEKFACSVCKKEYKYKRGLTSHLKTHFPYKLTCNICEETFTNKVQLKKHHKEEHPGVKPFPCPMCEKRYNQKYHLTYHLRVHSGDKPYSCDICQQCFTSKYILSYHLRLHSGDKRFSCDFCDKRFIKKCALTNHLRVHTGDKPFSCDICNKCFTQRSTLTDHLRGHRGEKRMFTCNICQKIFYYRSHLNRHLPVHNS